MVARCPPKTAFYYISFHVKLAGVKHILTTTHFERSRPSSWLTSAWGCQRDPQTPLSSLKAKRSLQVKAKCVMLGEESGNRGRLFRIIPTLIRTVIEVSSSSVFCLFNDCIIPQADLIKRYYFPHSWLHSGCQTQRIYSLTSPASCLVFKARVIDWL